MPSIPLPSGDRLKTARPDPEGPHVLVIDQTSAPTNFGYDAGAAGQANIPAGKTIRKVSALWAADGRLVIQSGAAIPQPAGSSFSVDDLGLESTGDRDLVFTGSVSYFVTWED